MYKNISIEYSIAIRTLGFGGSKYESLLKSIDRQTIKPKDVLIFIPYNYDLPQERLGYEQFIRCEKGMVKQRIAAIEYVQTKYILLLDDDVAFPENYVEELFVSAQEMNADVCISQMIDFASKANKYSHLKKRLWIIKQFLLGKNKFTNIDDGFSQKIWRTGGVIHLQKKTSDKIYFTQTGHGSHCFAKTETLKAIHLEQELWLEDSNYSWPEDQVMFYKLFCYGYVITITPRSTLTHLDGARKASRKQAASYAEGRNFFIFWHRFIYKRDKQLWGKCLDVLSITWKILATLIYHLFKGSCNMYLKGCIDGIKYVLSAKYKTIPVIP